MTTDIDVVIVTYNSAKLIARCIAAVRKSDRVAKIIVIDNASSDESVAVATPLADEVVALDRNLGFGSAQNIGVAIGTSRSVLILNPDAEIDPAAIASAADMLAGQSTVGAVQGEVRRAADGGLERSSGAEPGLLDLCSRLLRLRQLLGERCLKSLAPVFGASYFTERTVTEARDVDFLAAVALLVKREAFEAVGGFDERFFLYAEDIDLGHRLRQAGWRLVALPGPWAVHVGGASSASDPPLQRVRWWDGHILLARLHWRGLRRSLGVAVGVIGRGVDRRLV